MEVIVYLSMNLNYGLVVIILEWRYLNFIKFLHNNSNNNNNNLIQKINLINIIFQIIMLIKVFLIIIIIIKLINFNNNKILPSKVYNHHYKINQTLSKIPHNNYKTHK